MSVTQTEFEQSVEGVYAEIYLHNGVTAQSVANGLTYTKVNGFTSDGKSKNCTSDSANDQLVVTIAGDYKIECSLSFTGSGVNEIWLGAVFLDGVEVDKIHFQRKINTGGDVGSTQFGGVVSALIGDTIDIRMRHEDAAPIDFIPAYMNLNAAMLGA